ncbi:esterase/lipase family protein [Rossellomorea aquimaris]|uniref:esterase/lipase family protein n=1 Tax=Rossellomorea aquimaris TaxID=189382 RepID=UPI0007D05B66|nr:hypothetical protein [Rossellomorea aquimaris]
MNEKFFKPANEEVTPGEWFTGEVEGDVTPNSYPILFVHGINTSSKTWLLDNNMDDKANEHGFETAFIELYPDEDMWKNGLLLAEKLKEIYDYFQEKIVIVAHSKGGVDIQAALVHFGATPYVLRVITLSTPHNGSELADLAFSKWASWLSEGLNIKSNAVSSLQTGYMKAFRQLTDEHKDAKEVPFYTFGGTEWGAMNSELFWGGLYLSRFGQSDGAVTVRSSRLLYGNEVMVGDWSHKTIKEGTTVFSYIKDLVMEEVKETASAYTESLLQESETSVLHRGGSYLGKGVERFPVDERVKELSIDWISNRNDTALTLKSPHHTIYKSFITTKDATGFFPNAYHHSILISDPPEGEWSLHFENSGNENYLLTILFKQDISNELVSLWKGEVVSAAFSSKKTYSKKITIISSLPSGEQKIIEAAEIPSQLNEGIHNITIDISGTTKDGNKFERTQVKSIYVDGNGDMF